jgi:hypothetical protein
LSNPASKTYTKFVYEDRESMPHLHDLATWFFRSSQYQNSFTKSKLMKFKWNLASQKCTKIVWNEEEESKISYPPLFGHKSRTWSFFTCPHQPFISFPFWWCSSTCGDHPKKDLAAIATRFVKTPKNLP